MAAEHEIAELCWRLDERGMSWHELGTRLRSRDAAVVHAAILHLDRVLRAADSAGADAQSAAVWCNELPDDLFALPFESQCVLAQLWIDGFALTQPVVNPPPALPPLVRLAWLRAALLAQPQLLDEYQDTPLGWHAVRELPSERVIGSGLLAALARSPQAAIRQVALQTVREGLHRGLLSRADAHSLALRLADDENVMIAVDSLRLLQAAWTFALALPELRVDLDLDLELGRELLKLYALRGGAMQLRRLLAQGVPTALLSELLLALGQAGDLNDVGAIVECARLKWALSGAAAVEALQMLKRRGCTVEPEQARVLWELFLAQPAVCGARDLAEVLSSRADFVVEALASSPQGPAEWAACVAVLEALGTRSAIERLTRVVADSAERAGWWPAIGALGRLGIRDAEELILSRLEHEAEACLQALRYIGGVHTARVLCERLALDARPTWFAQAAALTFRLDPSESVLQMLISQGLLTDELLACLPEFGSHVNTRQLSAIALRAGDPRRIAAISALGRTGGPCAIEPLAQLLTESDDEVRDAALAALSALGRRLHRQRAAYPACLEASAEPGDACVADALVVRLRRRPIEPEASARLLESLIGRKHPQLVAAVRPHLRSKAPEVRKRALACLAVAGPEAAAWLLPWVSSQDLTVARQALRALTQTGATGLAEPVARWLDAPNMNMKKAAAEALATLGDARVVGKLLHWLSVHDNPGFRELLLEALEALLGAALLGVLLDTLATTPSARSRQALVEALSGRLSASEVGALIFVRGPSSDGKSVQGADTESWAQQLLRGIYEGKCSLRGGTLAILDSELARRGISYLLPTRESLQADQASAAQTRAVRAGQQLAHVLFRSALSDHEAEAVGLLLTKANVHGQLLVPRLSRTRVHALLDLYPRLDPAARAGALNVLSALELEPVARLRASRLLDEARLHEMPSALVRHAMGSSTASAASQLLGSADRQVQAIAEQVLLLAPAELDVRAWPKRDAAALYQHFLRHDAFDEGLDWARQRAELPALFGALEQQRGAAFSVTLIRRWLEQHPTLLPELVIALSALGCNADAELQRLAETPELEVARRSRVLLTLLQRKGTFEPEALCQRLLEDEHAVIREHAARWLWDEGKLQERQPVLAKFIAGAFRQEFRLPLQHADWGQIDALIHAAEGSERSRAVALLQGSQQLARIPRLLELWKISDGRPREAARTALRSVNAAQLLPYLRQQLEAGNELLLELVGQCNVIAPWLVELARHSLVLPRWLDFFERMAGASVLHAPGLCDVLSEHVGHPRLGAAALRVMLRCDDWSRAESTAKLLAALRPALAGPRRRELLPELVTAIEPLGADVRARILSSIASPADEGLVLELVDLVLETPSLLRRLPPPTSAAVEQRMRSELEGPPERVRKILVYLASTADSETQREQLLDVLEKGLRHTSSRVRLHAHRLLRTHAERARYLEATKALLDSADPMTLRSAIRALAFGRWLSAVPQLAGLVFHSNGSVRKAASEGLLHLGHDARAALARELNHARPDRRPTLAALLDQMNQIAADAS